MSPLKPAAPRAAIALLAFLEGCRLAELEAFYMFWVGSEPVPESHPDLVQRLHGRMRDPESVRAKLKVFTRAQREVLQAVVAAENHAVEKTAFLQGSLCEAVKPYETEAAARTLLRRGFLAEVGSERGQPGVYCVPRELGDIINRLSRATDRTPRTLFSLAGYLERLKTDYLAAVAQGPLVAAGGGEDREALVTALCDPERIRARVAGLPDPHFRELVETIAGQFGGILTRSLFGRIGGGELDWDPDRFRGVLEEHLLGTAGPLDFEAFGIGLTEEGVVLFAEVVDAILAARRPDPSRLVRRINLGADVLSDIQRVVSFLGRETVRITQDQTLYKTVRKRLKDEMILRETGRLGRDRVLDFLLAFMRERDFFQARPGGVIRPTREGLLFGQLGLHAQLKQLLKHVLTTFPAESGGFHHRTLLSLFLERFRDADPEVWLDPMELPFRARNAYLGELEDRSVKEAFQARYEYTLHPPRDDPFQMAWGLFDLLTDWFLLLGLVEGGAEGERIMAIRVTPLGRRLLGPDEERITTRRKKKAESVPTSSPQLIINPDFEVLLHPGPETLEVIYFLDRIAERLHADHHLHFRIDRSRFQDLVGRGVSPDHVIRTLEANARTPLPENVVTTLEDWATAVDYVDANQVVLLECDDPEVLDRVAGMRELRKAVYRRLGPNALALDARKVGPDLAEQLRGLGIFLR